MKPEPSFSISRSPPPLLQAQMKRKCETALTSTLSGRRWNFSIHSVAGRHRIFPRIDYYVSDPTEFPDIDLELAKVRYMTPEEAQIAAAEAVAEAEAAMAEAEAAHQEAEAAEAEARAAQAEARAALAVLEEGLKNERARRIRTTQAAITEAESRAAQAELEESLKKERAIRIRRGLSLLGFHC